MRRNVLSLLGLFLMLASAAACAAQVRASIDRNTVHMGDTLTLSITVEGSSQTSGPDLDPLRQNFDVQQTSNSRNFSFVNGKSSSTVVWGVALQPLHTGTITIPPLTVAGDHTQALNVTVLPAATGARGGAGDQVFVETSVQPLSIYVGQQALFRVRLFYADGLAAQGSLEKPDIAGVDLQQLGDADRYQTQRGGRSYNVIERDYALTVRAPGTITVPAISFRGQVGRGGNYSGFATNVRNVSVRAPSLSLEVKAKPARVTTGPWLPAQNVTLTASGLPADGKANAGDPLTLTLTEQAKGLPFEDLPALTLPDIAGAEVYPDKADTSTANDGQWLHGKRQRSFAIVPTRAGSLTIPAITVHWWNVETDKAEVATLAARTLIVSAAAGSAAAASSAPLAPSASAATPTAATAPSSPPATGHPWRWVATALLAIWLMTLFAWWWWTRSASRQNSPGPDTAQPRVGARNARKAFRQALDSGDGATIGRTLLAWAQSERQNLHSLGAVGAALADADQRQAIVVLERARYGTTDAEPDHAVIGNAFAKRFVWRVPEHPEPSREGLPPLYPFGESSKRAD